jgi:hypothetical protein
MRNGQGKQPVKKIQRNPKKIRKITGQIASDTSSHQDLNTPSNAPTPNCQNPPIELKTSVIGKPHKLQNDQILKLIYLIATFEKPRDILSKMQEEFSVDINASLIPYYRNHPDYQATIQKIREKWGNDLLHVELASKRRRLEELSKVYQICMQTNQIRNALTSIYQIQHEVEKDLNNLSLTNYNINVYKDMTVEELETERMKSLERLKQLRGGLPCLADQRKENQENNSEKGKS